MLGVFAYLLLIGKTYGARERFEEMRSNKEAFWEGNQGLFHSLPSIAGQDRERIVCEDRLVEVDGISYSCKNVDFFSFISRSDLTLSRTGFSDSDFQMADIWGWTSPSGKEITISTMSNGAWFIDSTDPTNPQMLGFLPSPRTEASWADVKVYNNTAYVLQDGGFRSVGRNQGIQVVDLLLFDDESTDILDITPDFVYTGVSNSHNIIINQDTGFLYAVGSDGDIEGCDEGLHVLDLSNRLEPSFVGCGGSDGYVHDAQCVIYHGPDATYSGTEVCFGFDEDSVTIFDVQDKSAITVISKLVYENAEYTHQGWLSGDHDFLLVDDELDEYDGFTTFTRTIVVDVSDLRAPFVLTEYSHPLDAIDHNLYIWGEYYASLTVNGSVPDAKYSYHANYADGLRIVNITDKNNMQEVGYFDTTPRERGPQFIGAWSNFMHPSGVIAVNCIGTGVFFLEFTHAFDDPSQFVIEPDVFSLDSDDSLDIPLVATLFGIFAFLLAARVCLGMKQRRNRTAGKGGSLK